MILELMPSHAETYHIFLKTIACLHYMQGSENEAVGRLTELIHNLMFENLFNLLRRDVWI